MEERKLKLLQRLKDYEASISAPQNTTAVHIQPSSQECLPQPQKQNSTLLEVSESSGKTKLTEEQMALIEKKDRRLSNVKYVLRRHQKKRNHQR